MSDFRQWPLAVRLTMPLWFPLFLLVATVYYVVMSIVHWRTR